MRTRPGQSPSKLVYCRGVDEAAKSNWPDDLNASDADRKRAEANGKWQPRYGVYAQRGNDFNDRCMKSGDMVVDLKNISLSGGVSRCVITGTDDQSKSSISLDAICNQKPNAVGVVARKNGDLVPPGSEKIIISKTDDQNVTFRKSRGGEFSEPAVSLAYCPARRNALMQTQRRRSKSLPHTQPGSLYWITRLKLALRPGAS
jgi:hypothetical protein